MTRASVRILFLSLVFFPARSSVLLAQSDVWQRTDGPFGCAVYAFATEPDGSLICGTDYLGIYRTTNLGERWTELHQMTRPIIAPGYPLSYVYDVAVTPTGTILAGTINGLIASRDRGVTWANVRPAGPGGSVLAVSVAPSGTILFASGGAIYRSTDEGFTWTSASSGSKQFIRDIAFFSGGSVWCAADSALLRSTDDGLSWHRCGNGLSGRAFDALRSDGLGHCYAASMTDGIFRSEDGGVTWSKRNDGLPSTAVRDIAVGPGGVLYAGLAGYGVYLSIDGGESWNPMNNGLTNKAVISLAILADGSIFCGTDGSGAFRTYGDAPSWIEANKGLRYPAMLSVATGPGGDLYAGAAVCGMYRSTDDGDSWSRMIGALSNAYARQIVCDADGRVYAGLALGVTTYPNQVRGLYRSTNGGYLWSALGGGQFPGGPHALAVDARNNIYYSEYSQGLYRSGDHGDTWTFLLSCLDVGVITSMAVNGTGCIFAETEMNGISRSTDAGRHWKSIGKSLPQRSSYSHLLVLGVSDLFIATGGGVFHSTDNGETFRKTSNGLLDSVLACIAVDGTGSLYVGSFHTGVYRSTDRGESWSRVGDGLGHPSVYSLAFSPRGYLFAATGEGVFRLKLNTSPAGIAQEIPGQIRLGPIHPNPFSHSTTIAYSLPAPLTVRLCINNLLGRKVTEFPVGEMNPGEHTFSFTARDLPNGLYYVVLEAGGLRRVKKLQLLR